MQGGYKVAMSLAAVSFIGTCRLFLHSELAPYAWLHFAGAPQDPRQVHTYMPTK